MLKLIANFFAYIGKTVTTPSKVFPCAPDYPSRVQPRGGYRTQIVLGASTPDCDPIKMRMANTYCTLQQGTKAIHNLGQFWLPLHHFRTNAVNRNIHIIKIVLRIDKHTPLFSDFAINKFRKANLAD